MVFVWVLYYLPTDARFQASTSMTILRQEWSRHFYNMSPGRTRGVNCLGMAGMAHLYTTAWFIEWSSDFVNINTPSKLTKRRDAKVEGGLVWRVLGYSRSRRSSPTCPTPWQVIATSEILKSQRSLHHFIIQSSEDPKSPRNKRIGFHLPPVSVSFCPATIRTYASAASSSHFLETGSAKFLPRSSGSTGQRKKQQGGDAKMLRFSCRRITSIHIQWLDVHVQLDTQEFIKSIGSRRYIHLQSLVITHKLVPFIHLDQGTKTLIYLAEMVGNRSKIA